MGLDRSLCVGGLCSCALGSIFALVAVFKGKEARSLQGITYVENLSGESVEQQTP